jgi:hypothetical protein
MLDLRTPTQSMHNLKSKSPNQTWLCPWCFATNDTVAPGVLVQVQRGNVPPVRRH